MKVMLPLSVIAAVLAAFAQVGIRPVSSPYEHAQVSQAARGYWVEHIEGGPSFLRHKWGGSWPIDNYYGESGRLWLAHPPGLCETFLVFDGAGRNIQRFIWKASSPFGVELVARFFTSDELAWDLDDEAATRLVFEDVDGDSREELASSSRDWIVDGDELIDNWGVRTVFLSWTGRTFEPRWARLWVLGQGGPLVAPDDPRSKDWRAAGLAR
ncbi:MAG TPA: hypothetical protein VF950_05735 [Planctomycetota bacterium]